MKLNDLRDKSWRPQVARPVVGRGIGSGRRARPHRARPEGPEEPFGVSASPASRAVRCRSTCVCRSAASITSSASSMPRSISVRCRLRSMPGKINGDSVLDGRRTGRRGVISHAREGVRLLGKGTLTTPLKLKLAGASASAKAALEALGGSIELARAQARAARPRRAEGGPCHGARSQGQGRAQSRSPVRRRSPPPARPAASNRLRPARPRVGRFRYCGHGASRPACLSRAGGPQFRSATGGNENGVTSANGGAAQLRQPSQGDPSSRSGCGSPSARLIVFRLGVVRAAARRSTRPR